MIDQLYSDPLVLQRLRFGPLGDHIDTFAQVSFRKRLHPVKRQAEDPGGRRFKPLAP